MPDNSRIVLTGTIDQLENKRQNVYIYLKNTIMFSNTISWLQEEEHNQKEDVHQGISIGRSFVIMEKELFEQQNVKIGNRVVIDCNYRTFGRARNFGNYDEEEYYYSQGIFLKAQADDITIADARADEIRQFLNELRNDMVESIYDSVEDTETAGILAAICTGDRSGLTQEARSLYQRSGIAHILAVSGLHISLVGMGIFRILRKRFSFLPSAIISGAMVLLFCMLTGMSPSGIRAAVMFMVQLAAIGLGKSYDLLCALSLSLLLLIISNPLYVGNSGFQMSFMAVFSIGTIYKPMERFLILRKSEACERIWENADATLPVRFLNGLLLSLSVTLGTLPVITSMYYEIPLYGVLLNILVVPLMSITLGTGLASAVLGIFSFVLGRFFAGAGVYIVLLIKWICRIFDSLPSSTIVTGCPSLWRIAIYYVVLYGGILAMNIHARGTRNQKLEQVSPDFFDIRRKRKENRNVKLCKYICVFFGAVVSSLFLSAHFRPDGLILTMLDVGQGECILIESPSGYVYMIDAGSTSIENVAGYVISSAIKYKGISCIDYAIVTHPDTDHLNGVMEMIKNSSQMHLYLKHILTPSVEGNENYEKLLAAAGQQGIPVDTLAKGGSLSDREVSLRCLHPDTSFFSPDSNAYSAVIELTYANFAALLTGDLEQAEEKQLLSTGAFSVDHYDILKVGHHGSKNSSSRDFLQAVSPRVSLISAGVNNSYGHPHQEVIQRLMDAGSRIFCTVDYGEIIVRIQQNGTCRIQTIL